MSLGSFSWEFGRRWTATRYAAVATVGPGGTRRVRSCHACTCVSRKGPNGHDQVFDAEHGPAAPKKAEELENYIARSASGFSLQLNSGPRNAVEQRSQLRSQFEFKARAMGHA